MLKLPVLNSAPVLVRVTIAMTKRHGQKHVGKALVYLADTATSLFITEGSQDRNSYRAGTWR